MPLAGAGLLTVTVPVAGFPLLTVVGFTAILTNLGAVICKVEDTEWDPAVALIVAVISVDTEDVVTVNEAVFDPCGTVTDDETTAFIFDDFSATTIPAGPEIPDSVTVPVELVPPATDAGETLTLLSV